MSTHCSRHYHTGRGTAAADAAGTGSGHSAAAAAGTPSRELSLRLSDRSRDGGLRQANGGAEQQLVLTEVVMP